MAFIHASATELDRTLREAGGALIVRHGHPVHDIPVLARECGANAVFANRDYEPSANARDDAVAQKLASHDIAFFSFKDQAAFDHDEVMTGTDKHYTVFTPYKCKWLQTVTPDALKPYVGRPSEREPPSGVRHAMPSLAELGFGHAQPPAFPAGTSGTYALFDDFRDRMSDYDHACEFPTKRSPSYLGVHLRHDTISIRALARSAHDAQRHGSKGAETWLGELVWREFYFSVCTIFRRSACRAITARSSRNTTASAGKRAIPPTRISPPGARDRPAIRSSMRGDAAMRQINESGYIHNCLRIVVASFLTKDLGIDTGGAAKHTLKRS